MTTTASGISNMSTTNPGSSSGNKLKIEPAAGTAKIIHPDDDISLVNENFNKKTKQKKNYSLIFFRKNFVLLCRNIGK